MKYFIVNEQIDESKKNQPDSREFTFNKTTGGRTFPSLVVVARPNLRNKEISSQMAQKERQALGNFFCFIFLLIYNDATFYY